MRVFQFFPQRVGDANSGLLHFHCLLEGFGMCGDLVGFISTSWYLSDSMVPKYCPSPGKGTSCFPPRYVSTLKRQLALQKDDSRMNIFFLSISNHSRFLSFCNQRNIRHLQTSRILCNKSPQVLHRNYLRKSLGVPTASKHRRIFGLGNRNSWGASN